MSCLWKVAFIALKTFKEHRYLANNHLLSEYMSLNQYLLGNLNNLTKNMDIPILYIINTVKPG